MARNSLLSASAAGAAFLIVIQMLSKLLTFVMNQLLLRYLSPVLLGVSSQFELFTLSVLYFSRESLRMALQRQTDSDKQGEGAAAAAKEDGAGDKGSPKQPRGSIVEGTSEGQSQTVINISYLSSLFGVVAAAVLQLFLTSEEAKSQPYYIESVAIFCAATVIELLSEPGFALAQQRLLYKLRAGCESAAVIARCVITFALTVYSSRNLKPAGSAGLGILPFALGQLGYACTLLFGYMVRLRRVSSEEKIGLLPTRIYKSQSSDSYYLHRPTMWLGASMWVQAVVKHILTQGDSILVTWFATAHDQGIYALAANYGSLVARLLFQPIEETSRNLFAKLLALDPTLEQKLKQADEKDGSTVPKSIPKPKPENISQAISIFTLILKFYSILSILVTTLGPPLAPIALRIVAGARWAGSDAAVTLASFCYYIPLLAVNGITEAFVQAVATSMQLQKQAAWMFAFSLAFGAAGWGFVKAAGLGANGLVWANCINMALRILWSTSFISSYFKNNNTDDDGKEKVRFNLSEALPNLKFVAVSVAVGAVARATVADGANAGLEDFVKAAGLAGISLAVGLYSERRFLIESYKLFSGKRAT